MAPDANSEVHEPHQPNLLPRAACSEAVDKAARQLPESQLITLLCEYSAAHRVPELRQQYLHLRLSVAQLKAQTPNSGKAS